MIEQFAHAPSFLFVGVERVKGSQTNMDMAKQRYSILDIEGEAWGTRRCVDDFVEIIFEAPHFSISCVKNARGAWASIGMIEICYNILHVEGEAWGTRRCASMYVDVTLGTPPVLVSSDRRLGGPG
jgi:hypothetical protein